MIANLLPKKTYHRKALYCFILSFISISVTCGQPLRDTLFINTANGEYPLYKHLYIYKTDSAINADFAYGLLKQGAFKRLFPQKTYSDALNVAHYYWLFFTVKNNLSADETFYCQLNSNMLNVVKAYLKTGSNGFTYSGQEGCDIPFKQRAYRYSDVVFPLMIKHGKTQTIVLQISGLNGEDLHCLPQLRSSNVFKAEEEKFYTTAGLITGVMLTVVILNIFLGISLKVKLHFIYAANVLFALYEIISIRGLDIQFLYPEYPKISVNFEYISICIWSILIINSPYARKR